MITADTPNALSWSFIRKSSAPIRVKEFRSWIFFDTEDPENGYDNCGYTKCLIMLLHRKSSAPIRVKEFRFSIFFDTEDPENGYDNCGYTKYLIMVLH